MAKNPIYNAILAAGYVVLVVTLITSMERVDTPDNALIPMAMLSLLVLSVTVMAYLFGYGPASLFFDGKREEAVMLFLKTVASFAVITALFFLAFIIGIPSV